MGLSDFFKKKSKEELFQESVVKKDYTQVIRLGRELTQEGEPSPNIINPYVNALIRLGREKEAVALLNKYAEEKLKSGYYSSAVAFLTKSFKYDPSNIKTAKLLSKAYEKKNLYFEAFRTLTGVLKNIKNKGIDIEQAKGLIEQFLEENAHPALHEIYGEILLELGLKDDAYKNFFLAGGMYTSIENYEKALSVYLKAKEVNPSKIIDKKLAQVISKIEIPSQRRNILKSLLLQNKDNFEFLETAIKNFIKDRHIDDIDTVIDEIKDPKFKWILLTIKNMEAGEIEEAIENIENIKRIDESLAENLNGRLLVKYPEAADFTVFKKSQEMPSADDILSSVFSVVEETETLPAITETFEHTPSVSNEDIVKVSQQFNGPMHAISTAEAMFGLGKLEEAEKLAKEALQHPQSRYRAVSILSSVYSSLGKTTEALNILVDSLNKYSFSKEEEKNLKEAIGKLYEGMGETNKASFWYKEAEKTY